jgi:hypothetical protein
MTSQKALGLLYKGFNNNLIYASYYMGCDQWIGNTRIVIDAHNLVTTMGPTSTVHSGDVWMVYRGEDEKGSIWWAVSPEGNGKWQGNKKICVGKDIPYTKVAPTVVSYGKYVYVIIKSANDNTIWWVRCDPDKKAWEHLEKITVPNASSDPMSDKSIAAAVYKDKLYIVYKAQGYDYIYFASFDEKTKTWSGNQRIEIDAKSYPQTSEAPAVAVYNGRLYVIYKSPGDSTDLLYSSFDGERWHNNTSIQIEGTTAKSKTSPAAYVNDQLLCITYRDSDNNLLFSSFDGEKLRWFGNQPISNNRSGIQPKTNVTPSLVEFPNISVTGLLESQESEIAKV